jgi:hypothetical protein
MYNNLGACKLRFITQVAKGVWNGDAPQGFLDASERGKVIKPAVAPRKIPRHAILGSLRMPMLVLDTAGMSRVDVTDALKGEICGLLCAAGSSNLSDIGSAVSEFAGDKSSVFLTVQVCSKTDHVLASHMGSRSWVLLWSLMLPATFDRDQLPSLGNVTWTKLSLCYISPAWYCETSFMGTSRSSQLPRTSDFQVPGSTAPTDAATVVKDTLSALGVQKIDLVVVSMNSSTCSTWPALEALVEAGSVLALGLVGATLEQVCEVIDGFKVKPVANFMELHPMNSERKAVGQLMRKVSALASFNYLIFCEFESSLSEPGDHVLQDDRVAEGGESVKAGSEHALSWEDPKLSRGPARPGSNPGPAERHLSSFIRAAR